MSENKLLGHETGLFALMTVQGLERFCYYGLRCMLVLFLITASHRGGLGWDVNQAILFYGGFLFLIYLLPIVGQYIAEHELGYRKATLLGSVLSLLGYTTIASAYTISLNFQQVDFEFLTLVGFLLLLLGNGLFKPNISHLLNEYYDQQDERYCSSHSLTYLAINVAAFAAPLIIGTMGEGLSWQLGLSVAAVVMLVNVVVQLTLFRTVLKDYGQLPTAKLVKSASVNISEPRKFSAEEKQQVKGIVSLTLIAIVFWLAFEQLGGLLSIYIYSAVDRSLLGFEIPATWFQALNPLFIIVLAPIVANYLSQNNLRLHTISARASAALLAVFVGFGILLLSSPYLMSADANSEAVKSSLWWMVVVILCLTIGELLFAPLNNNLIAKLAPMKSTGFFIGVWLFGLAIANGAAGFVGSLASSQGLQLDNFVTILLGLIAMLAVCSILIWLMSGKISEWLSEQHELRADTEEAILDEELSIVATHEGATEEQL